MSDNLTVKILQLPTTAPRTDKLKDDSTFVPLPKELQIAEPNNYKFLRELVSFSQKWSPRSPKASHEAIAVHTLCAAAAGRVVFDFIPIHRGAVVCVRKNVRSSHSYRATRRCWS